MVVVGREPIPAAVSVVRAYTCSDVDELPAFVEVTTWSVEPLFVFAPIVP